MFNGSYLVEAEVVGIKYFSLVRLVILLYLERLQRLQRSSERIK